MASEALGLRCALRCSTATQRPHAAKGHHTGGPTLFSSAFSHGHVVPSHLSRVSCSTQVLVVILGRRRLPIVDSGIPSFSICEKVRTCITCGRLRRNFRQPALCMKAGKADSGKTPSLEVRATLQPAGEA